ncbi:Ger(x)C family spore germination protein [Clostridium aciditolerans]|uniref:Ger(X)C family spore germination protein n=1 Tax=Clostridium aciditolerans TaxID=339861 RepID=A0A934M3A6_9CLOT|nr:Ger(x)C family spore germination protein [Clostridium aciditolerans]MBI6875369.1 Ger(x)C family spore germination protein [Clostridium aciditolerans]
MKKNSAVILLSVLLFIYLLSGADRLPAEELSLPSGTGFDIEQRGSEDLLYTTSISAYIFSQNSKVITKLYTGTATSPAETRKDRQKKMDKKFILGLEKVDIFSEDYAKSGIRPTMDIVLNSNTVNDLSEVAVCKGKASSLLEYKIPAYSGSSDYIEGMLKSASNYNFFEKNFQLLDFLVRIESEGINAVLPYIEIREEGLQITGAALFKNDKMVAKTNIEDARILNALKNTKGKGMLTIVEGSNHYIDFYSKVRRTVSCKREDDNYKFNINLKFKGEIVNNELYSQIGYSEKTKKEFENILESKIEDMCNKFLDKMKNEYKVDSLGLGRVAAAKYGRDTNVDWDQIVCNSEIKVKVNVKLDRQGRGDY